MKNINKKNLKKILYKMLLIRETDLQISKRYSESQMRCPTHLSVGQEAPAVGVCSNLEKKDKFILYSSIASIIADLEINKLIDDKNFAQSKIHSLSLQGKSRFFVKSYLLQKGIEKNMIEKTFENFELKNPNWESESAKIFARKKRLGIKYSDNLEKDLAKMARAGFNYKISKKILEF